MFNSGHSSATLIRPGILDTVTSDYVTTREAAKAIGVGHMTLLRWMKAGQVTAAARTPGGQYRWDLDDLRRQLAERKTER
jgi:excisionase family DNA binding protein